MPTPTLIAEHEATPIYQRAIAPQAADHTRAVLRRVVAEGTLDGEQIFVAQEILAKHDENYMPKEVAEALQKSGQWKPESGEAPPR